MNAMGDIYTREGLERDLQYVFCVEFPVVMSLGCLV